MASHPEYAHLPEGREPGYQSRYVPREATRKGGMLAMVVIGVLLIGVGAYFTAEPPNPAKDQAAVLALVFFGGIGLAVIAWAAFLYYRGLPKPAPFTIELDTDELRRGDSSRAVITCDNPAGVRGEVRVGVVCREFYSAQTSHNLQPGEIGAGSVETTETREGQVAGTWQALADGDGPVAIEFTVPGESPYSYEGHHVSLAWNVVVAEYRGDRPRYAYGPFWVLP